MRVIWKKVWRDIWNHKSRTLLVALSVAIGVFSIGLTIGILEILQGRMTGSWQATNPSHIFIGVGPGVTDQTVHFIGMMPGVEGAEGVMSTGIRWKPALEDDWGAASITARADYDNQRYDRLILKEGAWPDRDGLAVERGSARKYGIAIGDTVYLRVSDRPRPMQVVGVVYDATILPPAFTDDATFYVTRRDMQRLGGPTSFTTIKAAVPEYSEDAAKTAARDIADRLTRLGIEHGTPQTLDPERTIFQDVVDGLILILVVMSFLALGLGLMLVINTMTAIITEQIPQIGIMKAIGGTSGRVLTIYLSGVMFYVVIALLISIPLGIVGAYFVTSLTLELFNIEPGGFVISRNAVLAQLALGLLTPPIAALRPLLSGARITVREAISTYGLSENMGVIARLLVRVRRLPRLVLLTIANTFRKKGRLALTQVALVGGGAVFIMVLSVRATLLTTFDDFMQTYNLDIVILFEQPQRMENVEAEVGRIPGVLAVEGLDFMLEIPVRRVDDPEGRDQETITLFSITKGGEGYRPPISAGRWLEPQDRRAIVLNQHIAGKMGVSVGDDVVLELRKDRESRWTVVGLSFDLNENQSASAAWLEEVGRETGTGNMGLMLFIKTAPLDSESLSALADAISNQLQDRGRNVVLAMTIDEYQALQVNTAMVIVYMLGFVGVLIAIVGSVGLSGTLSINALERRKEVAMMRAVGASGRAIAGLFIGEGVIIAALSWLVAIPLSIPLGWAFANAVGSAIQVQLLYSYSLWGVIIWLVVVILLAVAASWLPAWRAMQVSVREALAYE